MKLHTLGTGGPRPDPERNSACHVLEAAGRHLMFDVGRGAIQRIAQKSLPFAAIGPLFVSHHHVDHIGELSNYLITSWLAGRREPLRIYGPPGTAGIVDVLMKSVYDRDIAFRTEGETAFGPFVGAEVTEVRAGPVAEGEGWKVSCEEMEHGHGLPFGKAFLARWTCLAYRVEAEGRVFSFSGDAVMCDPLIRIATGADLHLQCCYMAASEMTTGHFKGVGKYTLACSDTAGRIAARAGARRLVLTHFRQTTPALIEDMRADIARDFSGPAEFSRDLDEFLV
ncbi:MAG: MBL fold metallo-hydrolase [Betaproteobacteria bacterium]